MAGGKFEWNILQVGMTVDAAKKRKSVMTLEALAQYKRRAREYERREQKIMLTGAGGKSITQKQKQLLLAKLKAEKQAAGKPEGVAADGGGGSRSPSSAAIARKNTTTAQEAQGGQSDIPHLTRKSSSFAAAVRKALFASAAAARLRSIAYRIGMLSGSAEQTTDPTARKYYTAVASLSPAARSPASRSGTRGGGGGESPTIALGTRGGHGTSPAVLVIRGKDVDVVEKTA